MTYPTIAEVVKADREQIFRWWATLSPPLNAYEAYELIFKKFRCLGGSTFKPCPRSIEEPAFKSKQPVRFNRRSRLALTLAEREDISRGDNLGCLAISRSDQPQAIPRAMRGNLCR
jgi:hypothetical protein